jgi:hypothetical protein
MFASCSGRGGTILNEPFPDPHNYKDIAKGDELEKY